LSVAELITTQTLKTAIGGTILEPLRMVPKNMSPCNVANFLVETIRAPKLVTSRNAKKMPGITTKTQITSTLMAAMKIYKVGSSNTVSSS